MLPWKALTCFSLDQEASCRGQTPSHGSSWGACSIFQIPTSGKHFAQAMTRCRDVMSTGWKDQEAWCLTIHGVEMRVLTSFFTLYLECVDGAYIYSTRRVIFWTVLLKFKSEEGRVEVIRMYHLYTTFGWVSYITLVYIESIAPLIIIYAHAQFMDNSA